nr:glucose/ribitol dehydrogenase [Tanacetum cinerariifolium]
VLLILRFCYFFVPPLLVATARSFLHQQTTTTIAEQTIHTEEAVAKAIIEVEANVLRANLRDQEGSSSKGVSKYQQQNACRSHGKLYCVNSTTEGRSNLKYVYLDGLDPPSWLDYTSTKRSFTRGLALHLARKKIRVNGVALGTIWTPLQASALNDADIARYGSTVPMIRVGQAYKIAPSYVFFASMDTSYMSS